MVALGICTCAGPNRASAQDEVALDLSRQPTLFEIGYSHLDTQWRWSYPQVIREFLPKTIHDNAQLFQQYPGYIFNWTGANRYRLIREYYPQDFERIRQWVAQGRWFPAGSCWEENDVNVPSPESIIRQVLYAREFFKKEFGTESDEYMLPDCFGFPASLPSILAHCGLRGFSTQKLTWHSAVGIPFNVGRWVGPDGNSIIAALNPESYEQEVRDDRSRNAVWLKRIEAEGAKSGVYADFTFFGRGDQGGAPDPESVKRVTEAAQHPDGPLRVVCARADEMFRDISDRQEARLPEYQGDLLLTEHSAGTLTSQAWMKRWNHENELLADAAERAATAAWLFGAAPYPRQTLCHAWQLVLACQFHDMLPGTCIPKAYEFAWNDELIAMNCFAEVLKNSVGAVARGLDTRVKGTPLVIYNPLSIARQDVVEADLRGIASGAPLQVYDDSNRPVPTQMLSATPGEADGAVRLIFLAKAPPVGFEVYSVRASAASAKNSMLKVRDHLLENQYYRVIINESGDIESVLDKKTGRQLLAGPARLEFLNERPKLYPAWNMDWKDRKNPPRGFVDGPARIRVIEDGPVRVAVEIRRQAEHSFFTQTIRLAAGDAGRHVEVVNDINWQSKGCSLKAAFPLSVSNPEATYNWELGKIERGNNNPKKYEVPSHEWFDLTDKSGDYGVSILCPKKYGSDKPADNVLRLTLLFTPAVRDRFREQRWQDWGRHHFVYGIYGHRGDWRRGRSDWQAMRLDQRMFVFRAARHAGQLGRSFSLLKLNSDAVAVRAVKLAEAGDTVILRLQELNGAREKSVKLTCAARLENASEANGVETILRPLKSSRRGLKLNFTPYQLRTLALTLKPRLKLSRPAFAPVGLPYNLDGFSRRGARDGNFAGDGSTIPAEMIGDSVRCEGIGFRIGPRGRGRLNTVKCEGQTIALPAGKFDRLYLLAASVGGGSDADFLVDGRPSRLHIQNWTGYIGSWDNRVFEGVVPESSDSLTNALARIDPGFIRRDALGWYCDHHYLADGSDAIYSYCYLFKYALELPAGARTLTLPDRPQIRVVAATVADNENDGLEPAHRLYDDFTNRKPIMLPSSWANAK